MLHLPHGVGFVRESEEEGTFTVDVNGTHITWVREAYVRLPVRLIKWVQFYKPYSTATLRVLKMTQMHISSLEGFVFPRSIQELNLNHNALTSLRGCVLPPALVCLSVLHNRLHDLDDVDFPPTLSILDVSFNPLGDTGFPSTLRSLIMCDAPLVNVSRLPPRLGMLSVTARWDGYVHSTQTLNALVDFVWRSLTLCECTVMRDTDHWAQRAVEEAMWMRTRRVCVLTMLHAQKSGPQCTMRRMPLDLMRELGGMI